MELWDAYNAHLKKLEGITLVRGEQIPDGIYHLVSDVIVRHADGSYLLMQRDPRKHLGGLWEATAGGSALRGEDAVACAARELREETGIRAEHLTQVGCVTDASRHAVYAEFLCVTDCEKGAVHLQQGETVAYRWVTKEELRSMDAAYLATKRIQKFIGELTE